MIPYSLSYTQYNAGKMPIHKTTRPDAKARLRSVKRAMQSAHRCAFICIKRIFQIVQRKLLCFVVQTLIAAYNHYMFFALCFIKKSGNQISVLRNIFSAHRANSVYPRLTNWIAMGASAHCAALVRNIHRTINLGYDVFAFEKR